MKCYHCAKIDYDPAALNYQIAEAVGVCKECGEAVCSKHAVKSDVALPGDAQAEVKLGHHVLLPLLCVDCYDEIKALSVAQGARK
jgi:hypothetical protein